MTKSNKVCTWTHLNDGLGNCKKSCTGSIQQAGWAKIYQDKQNRFICGECGKPTEVTGKSN